MENEKTIDVLNKLVQINNDRIEGYSSASKETDELSLKSFFELLKHTSLNCKKELSAEIEKLGGTPTDKTKTAGKFFRVWMDVKAVLTCNNTDDIISSCEFGELHATETYVEVLFEDIEYLTTNLVSIIKQQLTLLNYDKLKLKAMNNMAY